MGQSSELAAPASVAVGSSTPRTAGAITCIEQHPPSGLLATAGYDGEVRLWRLPDLLKGQPAPPFGCLVGHGAAVSAAAFSACGAFLASCSVSDGTVRLWSVADREQLAVLQLPASSVAFASGDAGALLVAGASVAPQLLDLHQVPACQHYCQRIQPAAGQQNGGEGGGSRCAAAYGAASSALHPAAAMWLPGSPLPSCVELPVQTPGQHAAPARAAAGGPVSRGRQPRRQPFEGLGSPRQAGLLVEFSRKRRHQCNQQQQSDVQGSAESAAPAAASPHRSMQATSPCSWLPGTDSPLRRWAAASSGRSSRGDGSSSDGFFAWSVAPPLASPLASPVAGGSVDACAVPGSAVLAQWCAPPGDASGKWDAQRRCFVYRQGGHAYPVQWLLPLPGGLHLLTVSTDGEGKLWPTSSKGGSDAVCGTLLPQATDRCYCALGSCRPAVSSCGGYAVNGGPTGTLAAWDLASLQRQAHLPLPGALRDGNAAATAAAAHAEAVTAIAVGAGDMLLASGDASGRLVVRWL
ncbi:hypothetical protein ABPG77_002626 [Micractinium sp. CCAP 211/92]